MIRNTLFKLIVVCTLTFICSPESWSQTQQSGNQGPTTDTAVDDGGVCCLDLGPPCVPRCRKGQEFFSVSWQPSAVSNINNSSGTITINRVNDVPIHNVQIPSLQIASIYTTFVCPTFSGCNNVTITLPLYPPEYEQIEIYVNEEYSVVVPIF